MQVAKIWCLKLKKLKFGATMQSPEGLEDTRFLWTWTSLALFSKNKYIDTLISYSVAVPLKPWTSAGKAFQN